jgi:hypothetical protein
MGLEVYPESKLQDHNDAHVRRAMSGETRPAQGDGPRLPNPRHHFPLLLPIRVSVFQIFDVLWGGKGKVVRRIGSVPNEKESGCRGLGKGPGGGTFPEQNFRN